MSDEKRVMKAVGLLISELHSYYEGTRKVAMAQLILLGDKAVPYLRSFLQKELDLQHDLVKYRELAMAHDWEYNEDVKRYEENFKAKWGGTPNDIVRQRSKYTITSLLQIFEAIGDEEGAEMTRKLSDETFSQF